MSGRSTSAETQQDGKKDDPVLKDVEPGSDADESPVAEPGETPPDSTPGAQRMTSGCGKIA